MSQPSVLIYIHGFNSSPLSHKAQVMAQYCSLYRPDIQVIVPKLPSFPLQAAEYLRQIVEPLLATHNVGIIGSSLGGYFSAWLHQEYGLPAVLVNPAVRPYELLVDYLGPQTNPYTHEQYVLDKSHIAELKALDCPTLTHPKSVWLIMQTGDEVLDFQQAVDKYSDAVQTIEQGGDHSFIDFERYPEKIIHFLNL